MKIIKKISLLMMLCLFSCVCGSSQSNDLETIKQEKFEQQIKGFNQEIEDLNHSLDEIKKNFHSGWLHSPSGKSFTAFVNSPSFPYYLLGANIITFLVIFNLYQNAQREALEEEPKADEDIEIK
ncbi:hypothetical protein KBC04_05535 [Candidatus Babeliales bacterium]|nr:hypothetical protein [Candidatus Babeliales bacterium]MBP9844391.1 hypothetical protein [Candidatus Babeliales bacterium]